MGSTGAPAYCNDLAIATRVTARGHYRVTNVIGLKRVVTGRDLLRHRFRRRREMIFNCQR